MKTSGRLKVADIRATPPGILKAMLRFCKLEQGVGQHCPAELNELQRVAKIIEEELDPGLDQQSIDEADICISIEDYRPSRKLSVPS